MILKFSKCLNDKKEFSLISFDMDNNIDNISLDKFEDTNICDSPNYYYYLIENIIDIGNCEKFKIKVKKGDIVSLTARDNSYMIFPSKKSFTYAFNLNYTKVLNYEYKEVLLNEKPYEVKYVENNDQKVNDGVVYTLSQLCSYISTLIKSYIYRLAYEPGEPKDKLEKIIIKYYSKQKISISDKYELNIKRAWVDENNKWHTGEITNCSNSNKFLYDYYLLRMFSYMILTKSKSDIENNNDLQYRFYEKFDTLEDVYKFLEENQDIVNNFFIETEILFTRPNEMFTSYAPFINGIYMYYEYNGVKVYLYRTKDKKYFEEKSLKATYVSKRYKHKIKGIKNNYTVA